MTSERYGLAEMKCIVCDTPLDEDLQNLCDTCRGDLSAHPSLCQEQILSNAHAPTQSYLLDLWGRAHPLDKSTEVGRLPKAWGLSILDGSVSRRHADVYFEADTWFVRDLGSTNGVMVAGTRITAPTPLTNGSALAFGNVGFYFVSESAIARTESSAASSTVRPEDFRPTADVHIDPPDQDTFAGLPQMSVKLLQPLGGGGGFLEARGQRLQLSLVQYELLETLRERMVAEADQPAIVRGFVPTSQLLADLSWDTSMPTEGHLKQLVRRVRRSLLSAGIGNLIESRRGFGYRLRVRPV